jgi:hypothetical protein
MFHLGKFCRAIGKQGHMWNLGFIKCFEKETSHVKITVQLFQSLQSKSNLQLVDYLLCVLHS